MRPDRLLPLLLPLALLLAPGCGEKQAPGAAGLHALAEHLLTEAKGGQTAHLMKELHQLEIPDSELAKVYDDTAGKAPEQSYPQAFVAFAKTGPAVLVAAVAMGATDLLIQDDATIASGNGGPAEVAKAKLAEVRPGVTLYRLELRQPLHELGIPLGDFAFIDGAWRWVLVGPLANIKPKS